MGPRIGAGIRDLRKKRGLSLRQVEKITGINRSLVSRAERHEIGVSRRMLTRLAPALGAEIWRIASPLQLAFSFNPSLAEAVRRPDLDVSAQVFFRARAQAETAKIEIETWHLPWCGGLLFIPRLGREKVFLKGRAIE